MQSNGKTGRAADVAALGRGVTGFGKAFEKLKPDCVLVLGDRIEVLAAASAASIGGIQLAHIHGGDRAEGVADEAIRHAVSKLAHIHFPATAQSKKRLIKMGEDPKHICQVGSPAMDGLQQVRPAPDSPELVIMQHPVGGTDQQEAKWMRDTLRATKPYTRLVLLPNLDPGRDGICKAIDAQRVITTEHLPRETFLSILNSAKAIVGNSSAGLIEAAALRVPCVNIGPRQAGREKPKNVVSCGYGQANIQKSAQACPGHGPKTHAPPLRQRQHRQGHRKAPGVKKHRGRADPQTKYLLKAAPPGTRL